MAGNNDFTVLGNLLEKDILPSVKVQLYEKSIMWQLFGGFQAEADGSIEFGSKINPPQISFANNTIYITTQNARPTTGGFGIGNKIPYGGLPTNQGSLSIAQAGAAFLIPKAVLNMKDEGAIANALQIYIAATTNALAMDLNRQCYSDGSGIIGYINTTSGIVTAGTTVTLLPKASAPSLYNNDIPLAVRYLQPQITGNGQNVLGTPILIGSSVYNSPTTVVSVNGNNTFTTADNFKALGVYQPVYKLDGSNAPVNDMTGLQAMVSSGDTYMGMNGATDASWNAYKDTNSGSAKTFAMTDLNKAFINANTTGNVKIIVMNMTEFQKYAESLTTVTASSSYSLYRFGPQDPIFGGWKGLSYMGGAAAVVLDYDCPDDRIYLLSPEYLFHAEYQPLQFEPGTLGLGNRIAQQVDYEFVCDLMGNIGTFVRSSNAVLTNRVG